MHNAAYCGDIDTLMTLLTDEQYVNCRNQKGNTPLVSALIGCDNKKVKIDVLDLLMKNGADINSVNDDGDSILHVAVKATFRQSISNKIIERLIDHGADKTMTNNQCLTAGQLAFQVNNAKLGTLLLFYERPQINHQEERPTYSKRHANGHVTYIQTVNQTRTRSPGLMRSLIKFVNPQCVPKYDQSDLGNLERKDSFIEVDGDPNERSRIRRYYEDINISKENIATHEDLIRNGYENILEHLRLNTNEEGNFVLHLNECDDRNVKRTLVINRSSDDMLRGIDKDFNCSDT